MRVLKPELFQGIKKKKHYFEGWYYKVITEDKKHSVAIICGISYSKDGRDNHAFIQFFETITGQTGYFRFPVKMFHADDKYLDVQIGENRFTKNGIFVNLQNESLQIQGKLDFDNIVSYPSTLLEPGIMGPFSYLPFMECYHGVVNIHQTTSGYLKINAEPISFENGYGYVEKDWGKSFPKGWVWMQSNHFENEEVSFMFSMATVPLAKATFTGFIGYLKLGEKFYRFATYTGAKVVYHRKHDNCLDLVIQSWKYEIHIRAVHHQIGKLIAPHNGRMDRIIEESIDSELYLKFYDRKGNLIYKGIGKNAGLEMMNFKEVKL